MYCYIFILAAALSLMFTKYYQDKLIKTYVTKEYYYSSDIIKSQIKVMLENFDRHIKYILNSYFFMALGIFIIVTGIVVLHKYFHLYQNCHINYDFYFLFGGGIGLLAIQFYLEYYRFILPLVEESFIFYDLRQKLGKPIDLIYAINRSIETKSEKIIIESCQKFHKKYPLVQCTDITLLELSNQEKDFFENHPDLVGFLLNPEYKLYSILNYKVIEEKNSNTLIKIFVLENQKKELDVILIKNSFYKPFLDVIENEKKQQIINILDSLILSILLLKIFY